MSLLSTYICDQCGKQKETSNHWWIAIISNSKIAFFPWITGFAVDSKATHLCGEGCAAKLMSQWMETTSKATT